MEYLHSFTQPLASSGPSLNLMISWGKIFPLKTYHNFNYSNIDDHVSSIIKHQPYLAIIHPHHLIVIYDSYPWKIPSHNEQRRHRTHKHRGRARLPNASKKVLKVFAFHPRMVCQCWMAIFEAGGTCVDQSMKDHLSKKGRVVTSYRPIGGWMCPVLNQSQAKSRCMAS